MNNKVKTLSAAQTARAISNSDLAEILVKSLPSLEKFTSQGTANLFKDAGFQNTIFSDIEFANTVFGLTNRFFLNLVNIAQARDLFEEGDVGEEFYSEHASEAQRIAVLPKKPTSPKFVNLPKGGVNQQAVRRPNFDERFFTVNDNFQNWLTWTEWDLKKVFTSDYGFSELYAGAMAQLTNSYKIHKSLSKKACINEALNSTNNPLKDTQKVELTSWTDGAPTQAELQELLLSVMNIVSAMGATEQTAAFNAYKNDSGETFATVQDKSRLRLVVRSGIKNYIGVILKAFAFNAGELNLDIPIVEVDNFGGIEYYKEQEFTNRVYPAYDADTGEQIGWADTENQTSAAYTDEQVFAKDPNEKVLAVLMDKGTIFRITHNEQRLISSPYNAAGLYVNQWFSAPGNIVKYDPLYTFVAFYKPTE